MVHTKVTEVSVKMADETKTKHPAPPFKRFTRLSDDGFAP